MQQIIKPEMIGPCLGPSMSIDCLAAKLVGMPEPKYIYRGIPEQSLGVFFGPSKTGKTTLVESLALSIVSGQSTFLGDTISYNSKRVLLISCEEFFRNRTTRNKKQIQYFNERYSTVENWTENLCVVDDTFPRYFITEEHWKLLELEIERIQPSLVMIDSLTRLSVDPIEDSTVATKLMKRLREITHKHGIALILIHHTQKMDNKPITIASLAGSRVIGQEMDFMVGVNRTTNNIRYLKDVAYRYAADDAEQVLKFTINDSQVVEALEYATENEILLRGGGITDLNDSDTLVLNYITQVSNGNFSVIIKTSDFYTNLVENGLTTKPTLHAALNRLEQSGIIKKPEKGLYQLSPSS
jgi:archaellum biogenesis ATPase FlaH